MQKAATDWVLSCVVSCEGLSVTVVCISGSDSQTLDLEAPQRWIQAG